MDDRAALRQKVSAAFNAVWSGDTYGTLRRDQAWDAAIDVVLEEAAKVAERYGHVAKSYSLVAEEAAYQIAATIRGRKGE